MIANTNGGWHKHHHQVDSLHTMWPETRRDCKCGNGLKFCMISELTGHTPHLMAIFGRPPSVATADPAFSKSSTRLWHPFASTNHPICPFSRVLHLGKHTDDI